MITFVFLGKKVSFHGEKWKNAQFRKKTSPTKKIDFRTNYKKKLNPTKLN